MPIVVIIAFIVALCSKPKKRKVTVYRFPDYQKIQREREKQVEQQRKQIEQENRRFEREQEKQRKEQEQQRKQIEKQAKEKAAAQSNAINAKIYGHLATVYKNQMERLIQDIDELGDNPKECERLMKELIRVSEKRVKARETAAKAYYNYKAYETYINS